MIRHYEARRAKVIEDHPHNAEMSALFYGVLTRIVTLPGLTTSPMASAAPGVFWVDSRREPEPAHGPGEVSLCGWAAERPACPDRRGTCHLVPGQAGHPATWPYRAVGGARSTAWSRRARCGTPPVVLSLASQRSAQAACSARSLIPRSIFWVITKLTASAGSTMNRAHGLV
jgi:hypothetical protein